MPDNSILLVGVFGAAHGVRGEIRLKSFTADPLTIGHYGTLKSKAGAAFKLLSLRPVKDDICVARVEGINDRNAAEKLTNTELFILKEQLPAAAEDEFYFADLIGLRAEDASGALLGHVKSIENYGAGDILVLQSDQGEATMLPFTRAVVPKVEIAQGRVVIELPTEVEIEGEVPSPMGEG